MTRTAVVLFNLGGPDRPEAVRPFLFNLFFDPAIIRLPTPLRWLTANIGIHHVHHLYSRIPFYRLNAVLRDHPALNEIRRLTVMDSFKTVNLKLWCAKQRKLVSFRTARLAR